MDWVLWAIAGIFLIGIIVGVYRGALRIAVSVVTAIVTIVITVFVTPYVAQVIEEKTPLDDSIKKSVMESMIDASEMLFLADEDMADEGEEASEEEETAGEESSETVAMAEIPRDIQIKAIETADMPEVFKNLLAENNNDEIYSELGVETFAEYAGTFFARLLIRVFTFAILFLLTTIILRAIIFALNVVNGIPVFGLVNRLTGGVMGIFCSLLVVWFFFIIVVLLYSTEIGKTLYETISGNVYTKILFDNNPLLNISIKF